MNTGKAGFFGCWRILEMEVLSLKSIWPSFLWIWGDRKKMSNALVIQLDHKGKVKYHAIAWQGQSKDKVVYSKYTDLVPKEVMNPDGPDLQRPGEETIKEITEKKRIALEKIVSRKDFAAMPTHVADKLSPAQYICYTPSQQGGTFNSGAKQRDIQIVGMQKDPMEPPRFKISKKISQGPPSPPAPVMHSPPQKKIVKEQQCGRFYHVYPTRRTRRVIQFHWINGWLLMEEDFRLAT